MFVIINIIQNFYWFHLNVVLYFQNVMRVNIGRSLGNARNYLRRISLFAFLMSQYIFQTEKHSLKSF